MSDSEYPELDIIAHNHHIDTALTATIMLGTVDLLDDTLPPGVWSAEMCACCDDGQTVRMKQRRGTNATSKVRKVCPKCDEPDGTTIDDLEADDG